MLSDGEVVGGHDVLVVAEGVEKKEQAELLSSLGCNLVQGYFYARPMTVSAFTTRLQAQHPQAA